MFIINGTSNVLQPRCFVFESIAMARVIADKLQSQGFDVEVLDQGGELIVQESPIPTAVSWEHTYN